MLLEKLAIGISWLPDGVAVAVYALGALLLVFLFVKIVLLVVEFIKGIKLFWRRPYYKLFDTRYRHDLPEKVFPKV